MKYYDYFSVLGLVIFAFALYSLQSLNWYVEEFYVYYGYGYTPSPFEIKFIVVQFVIGIGLILVGALSNIFEKKEDDKRSK